MTILPKALQLTPRNMVAFTHDVIMAALSFGVSMALRLGDIVDPLHNTVLLGGTVAFSATAAIVFLSLRMYRGIWRYASTTDLVTLAKAVTVIIVIFSFEMFFVSRHEGVPRSVPIINWFVLLAMLGGPRFLYRMIKDRRFGWHLDLSATPKIPVLLVGASDEAELFIRDAARSHTPHRIARWALSPKAKAGSDGTFTASKC